ncbi:MAG: hypothetical protein ABSE93_08170 [Terriglobia bacterium]
MNIFLDSSALAKWYVQEPGGDGLESADARQCAAARAYGLQVEELPF